MFMKSEGNMEQKSVIEKNNRENYIYKKVREIWKKWEKWIIERNDVYKKWENCEKVIEEKIIERNNVYEKWEIYGTEECNRERNNKERNDVYKNWEKYGKKKKLR